jgi:hypothetical protein
VCNDHIDNAFVSLFSYFAIASLSKISLISQVNGSMIILSVFMVCLFGNDCIMIVFVSGILNVHIHCPLIIAGSIVMVSLLKIIVRSICVGISHVHKNISTYPLFVLYAISHHFSAINVCSCNESILAVKLWGLLII